MVKNLPINAADVGDEGSILRLGRSFGVEMTIHSSILAWRVHGQRSLVASMESKKLGITEQVPACE